MQAVPELAGAAEKIAAESGKHDEEGDQSQQ